MPTPVRTNICGTVEAPRMVGSPYRVDQDGRPFLPVGDGGVTCGVHLGMGVFATESDHAAPGACITHPDADTLHALTSFACLGNTVTVRTGPATGSVGTVLGKRGEQGRVIVCFPPQVLDTLAPGDDVTVSCWGQGWTLPSEASGSLPVTAMNIAPTALPILPVDLRHGQVSVDVRAAIPSYTAGNGIGRPAQQWDIDIQVDPQSADQLHLGEMRLGDLVAITDLDVRYNAGYHSGWTTICVVVHGGSRVPGHGPGVMPILCGDSTGFALHEDPDHHVGVTFEKLQSCRKTDS